MAGPDRIPWSDERQVLISEIQWALPRMPMLALEMMANVAEVGLQRTEPKPKPNPTSNRQE